MADESRDPLERVRTRRLVQLIDELTPRMRRVCPDMPDDVFREMIERMAELRLLDEEVAD